MTRLVVLDGDRFRAATPSEIFQSAESLELSPYSEFPHSFKVRTQRDAERVARWFATPQATPQLLCVLINEACEVTQYQQLSLRSPAEILESLGALSRPPYRPSRIWVFFVQPWDMPADAAHPLDDWLTTQFERKRRTRVRYLRIMGNQSPPVVAARHPAIHKSSSMLLWVPDRGKHRPAAPQEVLSVAEMLCARRLKRGQILRGSTNTREALQLCVAPLRQSSFGIVLVDSNGRFLDYRNLCAFDDYFCDDAATVLQDWRDMAEHARAMLATGGILVRAKSGPRLALNESEDHMIRKLFGLLWGFNIVTHACAVVGTHGLEIYNAYRVVRVQPAPAQVH